jgi:hypothetical protein
VVVASVIMADLLSSLVNMNYYACEKMDKIHLQNSLMKTALSEMKNLY